MPGIIYRCPVDHSIFTTKTDDSAPVDHVGHADCLKCQERKEEELRYEDKLNQEQDKEDNQ